MKSIKKRSKQKLDEIKNMPTKNVFLESKKNFLNSLRPSQLKSKVDFPFANNIPHPTQWHLQKPNNRPKVHTHHTYHKIKFSIPLYFLARVHISIFGVDCIYTCLRKRICGRDTYPYIPISHVEEKIRRRQLWWKENIECTKLGVRQASSRI